MNAFSRSWEMMKLSIDVMKKDRELFLFPVLAGIFSLLFVVAMVVPTLLTGFLQDQRVGGALFWIVLFAIYFGLAFIATFFNVCVVYTVKTRFDGKDAAFMDSVRFAFSRIGIIIAWSLVSATVGLILRVIDELGERGGDVGRIVADIIVGILGAAWSIITIFVVPGMVYHGLGPFAAIKRSVGTLKKTWGESLIRYYGLGLVELGAFVVGVIVFILLAMLTAPVTPLLVAVLFLAVVYFIGVIVFFNLANTVFNTALFVYAETGKAPKGYKHDVLAAAFQTRKK